MKKCEVILKSIVDVKDLMIILARNSYKITLEPVYDEFPKNDKLKHYKVVWEEHKNRGN